MMGDTCNIPLAAAFESVVASFPEFTSVIKVVAFLVYKRSHSFMPLLLHLDISSMESLRILHSHRTARPKGSFPNPYEDDPVQDKQRKGGKERSLVHKMKHLKSRMNKNSKSNNKHITRNYSNSSQASSFDQIPSKDSDIPEEEVVLIDYVDGLFEI